MPMTRKQAREEAFLLVYQYKFQPERMDELLSDFFSERPEAADQEEYIRDVVSGVVSRLSEIDETMGQFAKEWKVERISSVSLAAMRLGIYEIKYRDDVPAPVAVNEAVGLAVKFEGDEAANFVNGVLGGVQKSVEGKE